MDTSKISTTTLDKPNSPPYSLLLFLAREHGLATFETLLSKSNLQPLVVCTHRLLPQQERDKRIERAEYALFDNLCKQHRIPLYSIDEKSEQKAFLHKIKDLSFDFLISVSWRRFFPRELFERAKIGAINLHRGDLPRFAGKEPIRRALEASVTKGAITSHLINETIDGGRVLLKEFFPLEGKAGESLQQAVFRIKKEITPLFGPLAIKSINLLLER